MFGVFKTEVRVRTTAHLAKGALLDTASGVLLLSRTERRKTRVRLFEQQKDKGCQAVLGPGLGQRTRRSESKKGEQVGVLGNRLESWNNQV